MRTQDNDGSRQLDSLAVLALLYLALPTVIFLLGWLTPVVGWPLALLWLAGCWKIHRLPLPSLKSAIGKQGVLVILAGVIWSCFGGAGHRFHAAQDWLVRGAVFRDLAVADWPVAYGTDAEGMPRVLRCPLGYFLPAAWLAKVFGVQAADGLLLGWTAIGVALFLLLLPLSRESYPRLILGLLVVVFFSGMDIVTLLGEGRLLFPEGFLEWWAWPYHYASNTTLLLWAPNHSLPAWLGGALIMRHWRNPDFCRILPVLMAVTLIWTPFAFIGLAPFALLAAVGMLRRHGWGYGWIDVVPPLLTVAVIAAYFSLDAGGIPTVPQHDPSDAWPILVYKYVLFVILEFLFLGLLLLNINRSPPLILAIMTLLLIPLGNFGPGNDWVSRTSIAPLLVLCWSVLDVVERMDFRRDPVRFSLIGIILVVGAVTPINEFYKSIMGPGAPYDTGHGLREIIEARSLPLPRHYVARLNQGAWLGRSLLRPIE